MHARLASHSMPGDSRVGIVQHGLTIKPYAVQVACTVCKRHSCMDYHVRLASLNMCRCLIWQTSVYTTQSKIDSQLRQDRCHATLHSGELIDSCCLSGHTHLHRSCDRPYHRLMAQCILCVTTSLMPQGRAPSRIGIDVHSQHSQLI